MELMHGDGVAGSKLTWTYAHVTPPCHMVPLEQPILFYTVMQLFKSLCTGLCFTKIIEITSYLIPN